MNDKNTENSQPDVYMPRRVDYGVRVKQESRHFTEQQYSHDDGALAAHTFSHGRVRGCTIILVAGASGGIGTSTWCLQLAQYLNENRESACVIDADFTAGGLDVLLGCEEKEGLRWQNIKAPLGSIDARGFADELIKSDGLALLPAQPWNAENRSPAWWEIKAALEAAAHNFSVLVLDGGRELNADLLHALEELSNQIVGVQIVPVAILPLDVLGAARCQIVLNSYARNSSFMDSPVVLGSNVRDKKTAGSLFHKTSRTTGAVNDESIEEFLHAQIFAVIEWNTRLNTYMKAGWGLPPLNAQQKTIFSAFTQLCMAVGGSE